MFAGFGDRRMRHKRLKPIRRWTPGHEQLEKYHSVAIIVNHEEEALWVKSHLDGQKEAQLIISPADELKSRLVIIPLLLAKGLEFDAVILFNCIYANQGKPYLRRSIQ